jgi:hypothetical protein
MGPKFSSSPPTPLIMCILCVPDSFKSFAFGTVLYKNVISLADTQGLSERFERFKFGMFYLLIVKIRYNFTHK